MTVEEQRNLDLAQRYENLYNTDIIKFIHECYTADCVVNDGLIRGYEQFIKVEESVLRAAPKRKMRVDHKYTDGNVVVVQAVLLDPDRDRFGSCPSVPCCPAATARLRTITLMPNSRNGQAASLGKSPGRQGCAERALRQSVNPHQVK